MLEERSQPSLTRQLKLESNLDSQLHCLLPHWPDSVRRVPNVALRSALFGAISKGHRPYLERVEIHAQGGISIFYTGALLDQGDLDVWETVLHMARAQELGAECRVTAYRLLKELGKTDSGKNRTILDRHLSRMKATALQVRVGDHSYEGSLIHEVYRDHGTRCYVIRLNPMLRVFFLGDQFTDVDWSVRQALHGKPLAQWLHSFYEHKTIKLNLDATQLLAHLSHTHGVLPDKYPIKRGLGGGDRMQCGSRNLNVSDFLTKELHLPWPEAAAILRDVYEQQIASASAMPRARISGSLWASYRQTWPARTQAREADWASQRADEVKRRAHIKSAYLFDRQLIKADLDKKPSERKAAYSLASMHKVMADAQLYREIALERQVLREKHRAPGHDGYKRFLVVLASDWNTSALTELRRLASPGKSTPSSNGFGAGQELMASMPALLPAVHFTVNQRGDVTYYADHEKALAILLDGGQFVEVLDESARSVEAGLRLAVQKFGSALDIHGTPEFRSQVLDVVLKSGLRVTFKDPALANELAQMKARAASIDEEEASYSRKTEQQLEAEYAGEAFDDDRHRGKERSLNTAEQEAPSPVRPGRSRTFSPSP
ncbi:plasmid replication initiator TrfA [Pseudomonas sp. LAMO17WK12:I9]|nr:MULTISPECIES: plasmid replication initiator TrfA [unclassified Pseudomonas]